MPPRRRRNSLLIAGAAGCVAVGCAVALYLLRRRNEYLTETAPPSSGEVTEPEHETAEAQKPAVETTERAETAEPAALPTTAERTAAKPSTAEPAEGPATAETHTDQPPKLTRLSSAQGNLDESVFSCFLSHGTSHAP